MNNEIQLSKKLRYFSIFLLLFALVPLPFFYFQILRLVVSGTAFYTGWLSNKSKQPNWMRIFFIVGAIYNPIVPFQFGRNIWIIFDILVAVIIIYSLTKKTNTT